jgi:hypothetical protein
MAQWYWVADKALHNSYQLRVVKTHITNGAVVLGGRQGTTYQLSVTSGKKLKETIQTLVLCEDTP